MIETLINFFRQSPELTKNQAPEGLCPMCWGYQEYDNKIRKLYKDRQIDVNNKEANYTFIQDFVINHIDGIKLKKGTSSLECTTCKLKHSQKK